jgi:DNA-directed RNA polymerase specialized sigma24 family protein
MSDRSVGGDIHGGAQDGGSRPRLSFEQQARLLALYLREHDRMLRLAERALPAQDRDRAEDVVQTVFAEAAQRCATVPSFLPGEGWLHQRLRSRIADQHRQRYRDRRFGLRSLSDPDSRLICLTLADPGTPPDEEAIGRVTVRQLLATIPDARDRAALALRIEGLREADIARLLSLNHRTRQVREALTRARRRVLTRLEPPGRGGPRALDGPAATRHRRRQTGQARTCSGSGSSSPSRSA